MFFPFCFLDRLILSIRINAFNLDNLDKSIHFGVMRSICIIFSIDCNILFITLLGMKNIIVLSTDTAKLYLTFVLNKNRATICSCLLCTLCRMRAKKTLSIDILEMGCFVVNLGISS